jgi:hypothetical protein
MIVDKFFVLFTLEITKRGDGVTLDVQLKRNKETDFRKARPLTTLCIDQCCPPLSPFATFGDRQLLKNGFCINYISLKF